MEKARQKKKAVAENDWETLRNWNEDLEKIIPGTEAVGESNPASSDIQASDVQTNVYNSNSGDATKENKEVSGLPGKADLTPSDRQLLFFVHKYKRAEKICREAGIRLRDLQDRYAYLTYKLKRYIEIEGLFRETSPVSLTDDGIQISRDHLIESGFETDDSFRVGFKDKHIVLTKLESHIG